MLLTSDELLHLNESFMLLIQKFDEIYIFQGLHIAPTHYLIREMCLRNISLLVFQFSAWAETANLFA